MNLTQRVDYLTRIARFKWAMARYESKIAVLETKYGRLLYTIYPGPRGVFGRDGFPLTVELRIPDKPRRPTWSCAEVDCGSPTFRPGGLCFHHAGMARLSERQKRYLDEAEKVFDRRGTMPHCDERVLHHYDSCDACAHFPELTGLRHRFGIARTGEAPAEWQEPCPSEAFRPVDVIHHWGGNRPVRE